MLFRSARAVTLALLVAAVGILSGCSASEYQKPIGKFSKATADTQVAIEGYNKALVEAKKDFVRSSALSRPNQVRPLPGECTAGSTRCRLAFYQRPNDPNPAILSPEKPIVRLATLLDAFSQYAANLNAIATGTEAGDVEASVLATGQSLSKIAALVPGAGASPLGSYVQPVSAVVGWGLGLYVDSVKLDALKTAVSAADPVIARSGEVYEAVAEQATEAIKAHLVETVSARRDAYQSKGTRENLDKAADAADAYDAFLRGGATPASVFKDFIKAHADLNGALNSKKVSLADLMAQMATFQTRAEKLANVVKDALEASKKK